MKDKKTDGRINSPFRHKVEMEAGKFDYNDKISNFLEREKAKGKHAYNIASQKVDSRYSDRLYGNAYGIRNPELIEGLDDQHYSNPFERQYQINKRKSERVSVITRKPAKVQANLNANGASQSHFTAGVSESRFGTSGTNESNGWRKVSGWGQEFKEGMTKNWNDKRVNGMLNSIGGFLGAKFAKWSYGKLLAAGAVTTGVLTVGLYSGYRKEDDK